MGWSCAAKANNTLERVAEACLRSTGTQNSWSANGKIYFWEAPNVEHGDGHISCGVYLLKTGYVTRTGSLYLEPDGEIRYMPASLRNLL